MNSKDKSTPIGNISNNTSRFSPVSVQESPVKKSVNLTGNVRQVRDCVADLFNLIQEWNSLHLIGCTMLRSISDLKLPSLNDTKVDGGSCYTQPLQLLCNQLDSTCSKLKEIFQKMEIVLKNLSGITKLEQFQNVSKILFLTWQTSQFGMSPLSISNVACFFKHGFYLYLNYKNLQ
uniref:Uncharacterized protein n=1 Tax=Clastoptera arizonana TaxID=38151 RepID=A0A1B6ECX4_9HEMI